MKHLLITITLVFLAQISFSQSELINKLSDASCECIEKSGSSQASITRCVEEVFTKDKEALMAEFDLENNPQQAGKELALMVISKLMKDCPAVLEITVNQAIDGKMDAGTAYTRGKEAYKNGNMEEAVNLYSNAIRLDEKPDYYNERGNAYFYQKKYYHAISNYMRAIEMNNDYHIYYYNLAYSLYQLNDLKEAENYLNKALQLEPNYCDSRNLRGLIYSTYKQYETGIEAFKNAYNCNTENSTYSFNIGYSYYEMQQFDSSAIWFHKAEELGYSSPDIYNYLGNAYYNAKDYKKAIKYHKIHLSKSDSNYIPYFNLATCYYEIGNYKKTIQYLDQSVALEEDQDIYEYYTLAYLKLQKYDKALESANKALEISPDFASYYDNRAKAYEGLENYKEAIEDLKVSNALYKDDCWVFETLERLYQKTGQSDELIQTQEKLKSLNCDDTE